MNEREAAYKALYKIFYENGLSHEVLRETLAEADKAGGEFNKAWLVRLVNGTTERWLTFAYLIEKQSGRPVKKIKPQLTVILSMSLYQAYFMNVPERAAANEAGKLAKKHKLAGLAGFVNGVLRGIFRSVAAKEDASEEERNLAFFKYLDRLLENEEEPQKLSVRYSVPDELLGLMEKELGKDEVKKALEGFLAEKRLCLYRIGKNCSKEEFENSLKMDGISYTTLNKKELGDAYIIETAVNPTAVECFKKGWCIVQNASSACACELLDIKGDEKVIDVCAAPGGKAIHLAGRLESGTVIACDLSDRKCLKIEENIKRTGLKNIKAMACDATVYIKEFREAFDIVIADLPCSGLGVIASKPDIKYKTGIKDVEELSGIQKKILANVTKYLRTGGLLSFSTCTFTGRENEENAEYIKSLGFTELKRRRILPDRVRDGFFVSIFKKNEQ